MSTNRWRRSVMVRACARAEVCLGRRRYRRGHPCSAPASGALAWSTLVVCGVAFFALTLLPFANPGAFAAADQRPVTASLARYTIEDFAAASH